VWRVACRGRKSDFRFQISDFRYPGHKFRILIWFIGGLSDDVDSSSLELDLSL